ALRTVAAMSPDVTAYTGDAVNGVKPYREIESAVYLRSSMFTGTGVLAPDISSATTSTGYVNTAYIYDITASNDPTRYSASGLPSGLTCDTYTGRISGTPISTGTSTVVVTASNDAGSDTQTVTLTVNGPVPVITSEQAINAYTAAAISYQIVATNSATSYAVTGLPTGLSYSTSTGLITGSVSSVSTTTASMTATNSSGTSAAVSLIISVTTAPPPAPAVTSALTATATAGSAYSYQITASNTPTSYAASSLPTGLTCNTSSGVISGTVTANGTYAIGISATNVTGTGSATLTLTMQAPLPVITSATTASAAVGTPFTYQIAATNTPTSYSATGKPSWMSLNTTSGLLSGNPSGSTTTESVVVTATNSYGSGSATVSVAVTGMTVPSFTLPSTLNATSGTLFSYTPSATPSITSYAISGLPSTITMPNATDGALSGTPTTVASYGLTYTATNSAGSTTATTTLVVAAAASAPIVTIGARSGTGNTYNFLGTVAADTGRTLYTPSFSCTLPPLATGGTVTLRRGWITAEATGTGGAPTLTSTQFYIAGFKLAAGGSTSASISDTGGLTGSATRTY
ncbi:MAG: putative Ig domain-containing protein, partial [Planctomycetota bacterium]